MIYRSKKSRDIPGLYPHRKEERISKNNLCEQIPILQVTQPWRGSLAVETCTCGANTQERQQRARIQLPTSIIVMYSVQSP